jgi:hypothetical protein
MPDIHDPPALVRHAVDAGDWRLVELIARLLRGDPAVSSPAARRAHAALIERLGLAGESADYDRP